MLQLFEVGNFILFVTQWNVPLQVIEAGRIIGQDKTETVFHQGGLNQKCVWSKGDKMKDQNQDSPGAWSLGQKKEILPSEAGGKENSADGMEWKPKQVRQLPRNGGWGGGGQAAWREEAWPCLETLSLMAFSVFVSGVRGLGRHMDLILTDSISQPYPIYSLRNVIS